MLDFSIHIGIFIFRFVSFIIMPDMSCIYVIFTHMYGISCIIVIVPLLIQFKISPHFLNRQTYFTAQQMHFNSPYSRVTYWCSSMRWKWTSFVNWALFYWLHSMFYDQFWKRWYYTLKYKNKQYYIWCVPVLNWYITVFSGR